MGGLVGGVVWGFLVLTLVGKDVLCLNVEARKSNLIKEE